MFIGWLHEINYKILVGASALCLAIWLSGNDMIFNNTRDVTPVHIIFRWTKNDQLHIIRGCRALKTMSMVPFFFSFVTSTFAVRNNCMHNLCISF
jgi:hypothetical protein